MATPGARVLQCDPTSVSFTSSLSSPVRPIIEDKATTSALNTVAACIKQGDIVVFPTETVYGLGANALDPLAVAKIFAAKGRPADNPLIAHVSDLPMLYSLLPSGYTLPDTYTRLIDSFWPGPLTLLFPTEPPIVPSITTAGQPTVAVRMPSHPIARALIAMSRLPLAAPSANTSGSPSPTRARHVQDDLGARGRVSIILDGGPCDVGLESTVVDGLKEDGHLRVLRPGGVTVEQIQEVVGPATRVLVHRRDYADEQMERAPATPGMKYRHYSPKVPVVLLVPTLGSETRESVVDVINTFLSGLETNEPKVGLLLLDDSPLRKAIMDVPACMFVHHSLGSSKEPAEAGRNLFDGLIGLERAGVQVIFVEAVDEAKEGLAVMNRLRKAAGEIRLVRV